MFASKTVLSLFALAVPALVAAQGQMHTVMVGGPSGNVYSPANITAAVGDVVSFVFVGPGNHTVTQSSFADPCVTSLNTTTNMAGFDSSFQHVLANATSVPSWSIEVTAATPIWFYCRQAGHCGQGMVGSINANESSTKSYEAFKALAIMTNGTAGSASMSMSMSGTATGSAAMPTKTNSAGRSAQGAGALLAAVGLAAGLLL